MVRMHAHMQQITDQEAVGFVFQELREDQGLSQRQLAKKLGVSYTTVNKIERGIRRLNEDIIDGMVAAFEIDKGEAIQLYLLSSAPLVIRDELIDAVEVWRNHGY